MLIFILKIDIVKSSMLLKIEFAKKENNIVQSITPKQLNIITKIGYINRIKNMSFRLYPLLLITPNCHF